MKTPTLAAITILTATSALLIPKAHAVFGVGDVVYDPTMHATDTAKWSWEQIQWAEKLAVLHNSLTTLRENLQTLVLVKTAIGDPSSIPLILDELALGGALSESGILETFNELSGIAQEGRMLAMQLSYLAQPVDLNGYKNAARMGTLSAFARNADPLAKYRATEYAFRRYNGTLQVAEGRARNMRMQLNRLNSRVGTSSTDAETQKVAASISTADAALQDIEAEIDTAADQVQVAHTMAESRAEEEKAAYHASLEELNQEVEANLELPVEEISTVTPNF
jgi:hypothetical protein